MVGSGLRSCLVVAVMVVPLLVAPGNATGAVEDMPVPDEAVLGVDTIGPNIRLSPAKAKLFELSLAVAWNSIDGEYLAVWYDVRFQGNVGWRVTPDGRRIGKTLRVTGNGAQADQTWIDVAYNPSANEFVVVWLDGRHDTGGVGGPVSDVYLQRLGGDGQRLGGDVRVSGSPFSRDWSSLKVAHSPVRDEYVIVWADYEDGIFGQRATALGDLAGPTIRISLKKSIAYHSADVAYNPTRDQYLVVWQDDRKSDRRGWDVYGRRLRANLRPFEGEIRISGGKAIGNGRSPSVAYNSVRNQFLVVWRDGRNDPDGDGDDVYGQRIRPNGTRVKANFQVNAAGVGCGWGWCPRVGYSPTSNQYLVAIQDGFRGPIVGQRLAVNGRRVGGAFRISGAAAQVLDWASGFDMVLNTHDNEFLAVWVDERNWEIRGTDIYARRVTGSSN